MSKNQSFKNAVIAEIRGGKVAFTDVSDEKVSEKGRIFVTIIGNVNGKGFVINLYEPTEKQAKDGYTKL